MPRTYALTCCPCGQVSASGTWKHPSLTLAQFLGFMRRRGITAVKLVDVHCPDCFQARLDAVAASVETEATEEPLISV